MLTQLGLKEPWRKDVNFSVKLAPTNYSTGIFPGRELESKVGVLMPSVNVTKHNNIIFLKNVPSLLHRL